MNVWHYVRSTLHIPDRSAAQAHVEILSNITNRFSPHIIRGANFNPSQQGNEVLNQKHSVVLSNRPGRDRGFLWNTVRQRSNGDESGSACSDYPELWRSSVPVGHPKPNFVSEAKTGVVPDRSTIPLCCCCRLLELF